MIPFDLQWVTEFEIIVISDLILDCLMISSFPGEQIDYYIALRPGSGIVL